MRIEDLVELHEASAQESLELTQEIIRDHPVAKSIEGESYRDLSQIASEADTGAYLINTRVSADMRQRAREDLTGALVEKINAWKAKHSAPLAKAVEQTTAELWSVPRDVIPSGIETRTALADLDELSVGEILPQLDPQAFYSLVGKKRIVKTAEGGIRITPWATDEAMLREVRRRKSEVAERLDVVTSARDSIHGLGNVAEQLVRRRLQIYTGWERR